MLQKKIEFGVRHFFPPKFGFELRKRLKSNVLLDVKTMLKTAFQQFKVLFYFFDDWLPNNSERKIPDKPSGHQNCP